MRDAPADEKRAFWRGWGSSAAQRDDGDAPGALAGNIKARTLNCNSGNFCKPRAQWPGGNLDTHSYFHAPEGLFYVQESTPVIGGPGESRHWRTKFASAASPGDSLVTFSSLRKSLAAGAAKSLSKKVKASRPGSPRRLSCTLLIGTNMTKSSGYSSSNPALTRNSWATSSTSRPSTST